MQYIIIKNYSNFDSDLLKLNNSTLTYTDLPLYFQTTKFEILEVSNGTLFVQFSSPDFQTSLSHVDLFYFKKNNVNLFSAESTLMLGPTGKFDVMKIQLKKDTLIYDEEGEIITHDHVQPGVKGCAIIYTGPTMNQSVVNNTVNWITYQIRLDDSVNFDECILLSKSESDDYKIDFDGDQEYLESI